MSKNADKHILFVDTEATCWDTATHSRQYQRDNRELIEIAVVKVNRVTGEVVDQVSYLVKPINSEITPYCTKLTSITPEMVAKDGMDFRVAMKKIGLRFGTHCPWFSWGAFDKNFIRHECMKNNVTNPFSDNHFNLSEIYSLMVHSNRRHGMRHAMDKFGLEFEGTRHRALPDTLMTVEIYKKLFNH